MPVELVRSLVVSDMDVTGRTLEGSALRWDTLYRVSDDGRRWYQEGFRRGAARDAIERRTWFELRPEHADDRIGSVSFHESADALVFVATLEPGDRGDDELELVRSGRRSGVSIRYSALHNEPHAPPWWRDRIDLRELSLTSRPQFGPDAKVLAMRSQPTERSAEVAALLDWTVPEL